MTIGAPCCSASEAALALVRAAAEFDVVDYGRRVHAVGRAALVEDAALRSQIQRLARHAAVVRDGADPCAEGTLRGTIDVIHAFFAAQDELFSRAKPRYEPYASIALLRHLLGAPPLPVAEIERRVWSTFAMLLRDQIELESRTLADATSARSQFDPASARARIAALEQLRARLPAPLELPAPAAPTPRIDDIAADPSGARVVAELLVFPQTTCHDEVAFLRFIQLTECLFWGALVSVEDARDAIDRGELARAVAAVASAARFAAPLVKVFHAVHTIPPAHFLAFRDATGEASAVQSVCWQTLDARFYGVLPEKAATLAQTPEVAGVLALAGPGARSMVQIAGELGTTGVDAELHDAIVELDRGLRAWRTYHERRLAGQRDPSYLPPEAPGTGGTSGHAYLAAQRPPRVARAARDTKKPPDDR